MASKLFQNKISQIILVENLELFFAFFKFDGEK